MARQDPFEHLSELASLEGGVDCAPQHLRDLVILLGTSDETSESEAANTYEQCEELSPFDSTVLGGRGRLLLFISCAMLVIAGAVGITVVGSEPAARTPSSRPLASPTIAPPVSVTTLVAPEFTEPQTTESLARATVAATTLPTLQRGIAFGDFVMEGAADDLERRGFTVDAVANRAFSDVVSMIEELSGSDSLDGVVILHLGGQENLTQQRFDRVMTILQTAQLIVVVNISEDVQWSSETNAVLSNAVAAASNAVLVDWSTRSKACPGDCFTEEGSFLSADGSKYYADLVSDAVDRVG